MKSIKKKIWAVVFMLVMVLTMIPQAVSAKEVEKRVAINVKVPADWTAPCVWAWDEEGNNAFEAWPGGETEANPNNEGWNYVWIPDWANHVIINANAGEVQTDEIILDAGKDAWVVVAEDKSAEVSYEAMTEGDTPEYVEKFLIHAKVDDSWTAPCLWAWSAPDGTNAYDAWPGKAMQAKEDGWYTASAPVWVNSIIVNGNDGSVQTEDLSIDAAEIWVTVDKDGKAEFSYKDPDKAEVENITVHVKAPSDWTSPCLWAWSAPDGTNVFATWPGEALEEDGEWLVKEIPGWVNSIIVNGNDGSVQTSDLSIETGKDVWVLVEDAETAEIYYEEPAGDVDAGIALLTENETEVPVANNVEKSNNQLVIFIVIALIVVLAGTSTVIIMKKKQSK